MNYRRFRLLGWGILSIAILNSCTKGHPPLDVPTTLPNVIFPFRVYPDKIHLKLGDTLKLHAAISAKLDDSIRLYDGSVSIGIDFLKSSDDSLFISERYAVQNEDYALLMYGNSDLRRHETRPGLFLGFNTSYANDSFSYDYDFIFLEKGVYCFQFGSSQNHLISSRGKSYPSGYFDMADRHWQLLQLSPGRDTLQPGAYGYENAYFIRII